MEEIRKSRMKIILQIRAFRLRTNQVGQPVLTNGKRPKWPKRKIGLPLHDHAFKIYIDRLGQLEDEELITLLVQYPWQHIPLDG